MADRSQAHQVQVHPQRYDVGAAGGYDTKGIGGQQRGPSTGKVLAVVTLLPVGGTLLFLAGITLVGTLIGMALSAPVFLLFSPILVPAAFVVGLSVMAFLASGAFGLTGLTSLSWLVRYVREATGSVPEQLDMAKRRMAGMADYVGQKTKETGQEIQRKAHEAK